MTYLEFLDRTRRQVKENLNDYLEGVGLPPVRHFVNDSFSVIERPMSLAVYADTPEGQVYLESDGFLMGKVTIEFYLNDTADPSNVELLEMYFSAIASFLSRTMFGEHSLVSDSQIVRTDTGSQFNEALYLITSRIGQKTDAYYC